MRLPETDNPHYQHAFKRGYRHALEGKSVFNMPSDFRRVPKKRHYFEMGWQQANDDLAEQQQHSSKPDWKSRGIWFTFAIIAGVLTAKLMIENIEAEIDQQQARIDPPTILQSTPHPATLNQQALRILNPEAYQDLKKTAEEYTQAPKIQNTPVIASDLVIENVTLNSPTSGKSYPAQSVIPKFERQLAVITQIQAPGEVSIFVRWRYQNTAIKQQKTTLTKGMNLVQSQQAMSSARQGRWYLELLNVQAQVIYRKEFYYGTAPTQ